ncbi:MAG: 1-deoxy-D-xylulose-5-phosphate synthase [Planctomycetia bacterium]|jgi:1-deoxy-D-xylulose-5-phosphate synthase
MDELLSKIKSPADLQGLTTAQLEQLAGEMREALCRLVSRRSAHFASNLGVVELALALHSTFDFSHDRLIWDTGHQIYPHKMLTGRYDQFHTIRSLGGLMGYPNPKESEYDLFMTGHAGCSVSTLLGLRCGDDLAEQAEARRKAAEEGRLDEELARQEKRKKAKKLPAPNRHAVAVIGDGAFPSGVVFEAMNNAGWLKKELTVVLNDNQMSICPRVGSMGDYLDRLRMTPFYAGLKNEVQRVLHYTPLIGEPIEKLLMNMKDSLKAGLLGGMLFEQLNFRYIGPVDGHNIGQLQKYLAMAREFKSPVLLHVVTEKGHGFEPAEEDPTSFHAPAPFERNGGLVEYVKTKESGKTYTEVMSDALDAAMEKNEKVAVITAAMCQGNKLESIREKYEDRLFDVGICESHAVAFAAGLAKTGMRPVVDIYSTFMQRSYDQIFQEVALQNLPIMLAMDRAGLVGPDGPTHHGVFDITYLRPMPNLVIMSPGDAADLTAMVDFSLTCDYPTAVRYPRSSAKTLDRDMQPIELGCAEMLCGGNDGVLIAFGPLVADCLEVAEMLKEEDGLEIGVINARFVKPLDTETILSAIRDARFAITVEEGQLMGGFGSAVLEAASEAGVDTSCFRRLGIPDRFVTHGTRDELLAEVGLNPPGILGACREMAVEAASKL